MDRAADRKINILSAVIALLALSATFVTDKRMFVFPEATDARYDLAVTDYTICKIIAFLVLFTLLRFIFTIALSKGEKRQDLLEVLKCAAFYLPVILACLVIKLPGGYVTNDEYSILSDATSLTHDTWFNYMTVYYYIVSLMLIPVKYGPIFMKALIEFFIVGYCVFRSKRYFGSRAGAFMYALFLLYPVIAYTTSAHRLPVYFLIYLALFCKLTFDRLEKKDITLPGASFILLSGAVLTQWRTEGIYLLALIPILMLLVYPNIRNIRYALLVIIAYAAVQFIISIPQNGMGSDLGGAANDRMKPFYAYTITNMLRNGLDRDKNAADLEIVDRYLSLGAIDRINEHYGDINYEDVLILYKEEFLGVREDAGYTEYWEFTEALRRIFANNPDVFVRTRIGAFCYAAVPYHITYSGASPKALAALAVSIVKSLAYNLFIPAVFAALMCIVCLIKRKWFGFFVAGGLIAHWSIVFVLAPASYFKYYFPVYIMSYFFITVLLIWNFAGKKRGLSCPAG